MLLVLVAAGVRWRPITKRHVHLWNYTTFARELSLAKETRSTPTEGSIDNPYQKSNRN